MNKKMIVEMLKDSDKKRRQSYNVYLSSNSTEQGKVVEMYLVACAEYDALAKMVLAFGYMVQRDENDEIISIKKIVK